MKLRRFAPALLGAVILLSGCHEKPSAPTLPMPDSLPTVPVTTPAATPEERLASESAAALQPMLPDGFTLEQVWAEGRLSRTLRCGTGALKLPDLTLSAGTLRGEITPSALADESLMADACALAEAGMTVDLSQAKANLTHDAMNELLTGALEALGGPLDAAEVDPKVQDPSLRKALAIGIEPWIPEEEVTCLAETVTAEGFRSALIAALVYAEDTICANAGTTATLTDAVRQWPILSGEEEAPFTLSNAGLTRMSLARSLYRVYTERFPGVSVDEEYSIDDLNDVEFDDANTVRVLLYNRCMGTMPEDSSTFSPDLPVLTDELPQLLGQFQAACVNGPADSAQYADSDPVPWRTALNRAARLAAAYRGRVCTQEAREVINLPGYSIYVSQRDGSEYDYVNCMPSITCMALKWWNETSTVTPAQLRSSYDSTSGWYMYMVTETLEEFGVPWYSAEVTAQTIRDALDEGGIVLAQFSERDVDDSGHCFLIAGYRALGGALWFYVEDPEGEEEGVFGRPKNDGKWLEAERLLWTVDRFTSEVIVIPARDGDREAGAMG